jgi:hypothetical protein
LGAAAEQRSKPVARSADENRQPTAGRYVRDGRARIVEESRDGVLVVRFRHVEQVVWHAAPLLGRGLGSADVHAAVHASRVDRDDLSVVPHGQLDRKRALADGGRSDDG